jgi:DNA-binding XRE family transcriptional regulator
VPRPPTQPVTDLGSAMQAKRGDVDPATMAARIGLKRSTYYSLERGSHRPSYETALVLAAWLGPEWTIERIMATPKRSAA